MKQIVNKSFEWIKEDLKHSRLWHSLFKMTHQDQDEVVFTYVDSNIRADIVINLGDKFYFQGSEALNYFFRNSVTMTGFTYRVYKKIPPEIDPDMFNYKKDSHLLEELVLIKWTKDQEK